MTLLKKGMNLDDFTNEELPTSKLDNETSAALLNVLQKKENIESLPKLSKENFRVDSTGRKQLLTPSGMKIKINSLGDIVEYVDGIPDRIKGEQLFLLVAAKRETNKIGKKMMKTSKDYERIINVLYNSDIGAFKEAEKIKFTGRGIFNNTDFGYIEGNYRVLGNGKVYQNPHVFHSRCEDGSDFFFGGNNDHIEYDDFDEEISISAFFSVRCIEE